MCVTASECTHLIKCPPSSGHYYGDKSEVKGRGHVSWKKQKNAGSHPLDHDVTFVIGIFWENKRVQGRFVISVIIATRTVNYENESSKLKLHFRCKYEPNESSQFKHTHTHTHAHAQCVKLVCVYVYFAYYYSLFFLECWFFMAALRPRPAPNKSSLN